MDLYDIFPLYANCNLETEPSLFPKIVEVFREIPKGFHDISRAKQARRSRSLEQPPFQVFLDIGLKDHINILCWYFADLLKCGTLNKAREIRKEKESRNGSSDQRLFEIAFEAVHGYRNGFCETGCPYREYRKSKFGIEKFSGSDRLKCFECDQLFFKQILKEIVEGKEYLDIGPDRALERLISGSCRNFRRSINAFTISNDNRYFSQEIFEFTFFVPAKAIFKNSGFKNGFRELFLEQFVAFSLTEFLLTNNRKKIKLCPYCKKFFIATDLRRKKCYEEACNREYERLKKQEQREDDPVKYC
jgi:hypothetical protein